MASIVALIALVLLATTASPNPSPEPGCADAISPGLPPNNLTDSVTTQCCEDVFSSGALDSPHAKPPLVFGSPFNESQVISLPPPTVCASGNGTVTTEIGVPVGSICSESPPLPPPVQGSSPEIEIAEQPGDLDLSNDVIPARPTPAIPSSSAGKHTLAFAIYFVNYVM